MKVFLHLKSHDMQLHNTTELIQKNYKQSEVQSISCRILKTKRYLLAGIVLATLLGHVSFRYPAISNNVKMRTTYHEFSHTAVHAAAIAAIDNESTLATYAEELSSWIESAQPLLSNIKQFFAYNSKAFIISAIIVTAVCYGLYNEVSAAPYRSDARRVIKTLPKVTNFPDSFKFSEDEQDEIARFVEDLRNRTGLELVNFELPAEVPDCLRTYCTIYEEEAIPTYMHDIIKQAVHNVGISAPIFFYQTTCNTHASSKWFNRIGLHPKHIAYLNPIFKKAAIYLEDSAENCLRTLYHELCHIKGQHTIYTLSTLYKTLIEEATNYESSLQNALDDIYKKISDELATLSRSSSDGLYVESALTDISIKITYIKQKKELFNQQLKHLSQQIQRLYNSCPPTAHITYELYQEMEAELGAIYYLKRFHKIIWNSDGYVEDAQHPTSKDQLKYNRRLLQRLRANRHADYTVVQELAKEYLIAKERWFADLFELKQFIADLTLNLQPELESMVNLSEIRI